jgi:hypothetical protein
MTPFFATPWTMDDHDKGMSPLSRVDTNPVGFVVESAIVPWRQGELPHSQTARGRADRVDQRTSATARRPYAGLTYRLGSAQDGHHGRGA